MKENYEDIYALTDQEPLWYDQNGTPRFAKFEPKLCPNIYARHVFLILIGCQSCGKRFVVEMHTDFYTSTVKHPKHLHYGDPPIHGCVGDTMNCDDILIVEAWARNTETQEWERVPEWEIIMPESLSG